jgi:hypothetical protein
VADSEVRQRDRGAAKRGSELEQPVAVSFGGFESIAEVSWTMPPFMSLIEIDKSPISRSNSNPSSGMVLIARLFSCCLMAALNRPESIDLIRVEMAVTEAIVEH